MIIETKVYSCRKCQSEDLVKNGTKWSFVFRRKDKAWVWKTGGTAHIERWDNTLRQQLARFLRKTLSFSKCVKIHEICLKLFIHRYNTELLPIVG